MKKKEVVEPNRCSTGVQHKGEQNVNTSSTKPNPSSSSSSLIFKDSKSLSPGKKDDPPKVQPKDISDTTKAIRAWITEYSGQIGKPPDMSHGKDQKIMKGLVDANGLKEVMDKISAHIAGRKMLTIGGFKVLYNDLGVTPAKSFETFEEKNDREREELRRKYR